MYATSAAECQVSLITTMPLEARASWAIKFSALKFGEFWPWWIAILTLQKEAPTQAGWRSLNFGIRHARLVPNLVWYCRCLPIPQLGCILCKCQGHSKKGNSSQYLSNSCCHCLKMLAETHPPAKVEPLVLQMQMSSM